MINTYIAKKTSLIGFLDLATKLSYSNPNLKTSSTNAVIDQVYNVIADEISEILV